MGFPNHFGYCRQSASALAILLTHKCRSRLFMSREKRSAARFAWLDFAWLDGVWPIAKKLRVVYGSWFLARTQAPAQAQAPARVRLRRTVVMHMKIRPRNYSSRTLHPAAALSLHCNSGRAWHPRKTYPSADQITPDQIRPCYVIPRSRPTCTTSPAMPSHRQPGRYPVSGFHVTAVACRSSYHLILLVVDVDTYANKEIQIGLEN
jgi:hypothetical protein